MSTEERNPLKTEPTTRLSIFERIKAFFGDDGKIQKFQRNATPPGEVETAGPATTDKQMKLKNQVGAFLTHGKSGENFPIKHNGDGEENHTPSNLG